MWVRAGTEGGAGAGPPCRAGGSRAGSGSPQERVQVTFPGHLGSSFWRPLHVGARPSLCCPRGPCGYPSLRETEGVSPSTSLTDLPSGALQRQ